VGSPTQAREQLMACSNKDMFRDENDLLNELYAEMLKVAYVKMRNRMDALDVVQESWLKILQNIDRLRDKEKLFQWAKTIVSNTAINILKKKSMSRPNWRVGEEAQVYSADIVMENEALKMTMSDAMEHLDELTKKIFILKYYHECKVRHIAEILQLPEGTVKARIHRGKERLRSILQHENS
jgi:RNA polymerase sigma-70 factor (ECF subfamily)